MDKQFACAVMLYDMDNAETIVALTARGWKVECKTGDGPWRDANALVSEGEEFEFEDRWDFRISKGDVTYERSCDLYPIANKAIYDKEPAL